MSLYNVLKLESTAKVSSHLWTYPWRQCSYSFSKTEEDETKHLLNNSWPRVSKMSKIPVTRLQPFSLNAFVIVRAHQKSKVQSVNTCFLYTKVNMKENTLAPWNSVSHYLKQCREIIRVKKSKRMDIWDRHLSLGTIWSGSVGMEMRLQLIHPT